jgi:16S rRNA (cytosine967-C5)-methyltransferase
VRVETTDAFADVLLGERTAAARMGLLDNALAARLVYGTLAWQGRLDYHLAGLVRMPLARLDPPVRTALRLGLYQIMFLARVPAYAAVDASVRLVRRDARSASGLVNAVLRRAATAGAAGLPLPDPAADALERLSVEWSHPRWLVERWATEMGIDDLPRLLAADNERGATTIRANTARERLLTELAGAGIEAQASRWAEHGIVLARGAARLRRLPAWREGLFAFQGEASQLIAPLLGIAPGARVLDACAAPGGKACHAATLAGDAGLVVALEPRAGRLGRMREEAARLGARVQAIGADARQPPLRGHFDAILVDAPCSGLGTLRRHPELRWRRRPEDIPRLAALQRAIVAGVAPLVRPGGTLVYAVCTSTREETVEVVGALCAAEPRFAVEAITSLPGPLVDAAGFLRTFPHRHDLDGFFAARLRARS